MKCYYAHKQNMKVLFLVYFLLLSFQLDSSTHNEHKIINQISQHSRTITQILVNVKSTNLSPLGSVYEYRIFTKKKNNNKRKQNDFLLHNTHIHNAKLNQNHEHFLRKKKHIQNYLKKSMKSPRERTRKKGFQKATITKQP